jgi:hypothetical protein
MSSDSVEFNVPTTKFESVTFRDDLIVRTQRQWKLFFQENFRMTTNGWSDN